MKAIQILVSLLLIVIIGCSHKTKQVNQFTSSSDTLVIQTQKIKGYGLFTGGGGNIEFRDTSESSDFRVVFPKGITNIRIGMESVDYKPLWYRNIIDEKSPYLTTFLKDYFPTKIDTSKFPSVKDNSISIMTGLRGKDSIFIVDQNNNKDFRDDSVRLVQPIDWSSNSKLIKCKYKIYNGKRMTEDSSWVNIGTNRNSDVLFFVTHHLEANFTFDNQPYQVGVVNGAPFLRFCFDSPILALTVQPEVKKDTLYEADLLKKGEYLKLKDTYYRFTDISNDGKNIVLVKENDFSSKIGTQAGMLAPDFRCKSLDGDSIRFRDYKGKYLLLINVSACWSKESSYKCYKDLTETYKGKLEFLGIDKSPVFLSNNIKELKLTGKFINANENNTIEAYRPDFCSRTCFLINPDGRIIDKFEIFDWKQKLDQLFGQDTKLVSMLL
jgi:peroxiredoxin